MDKSKIGVAYEYKFHCGKNASQTARNINEVFGDNVANERTVRQWFERFRTGGFSLGNQPHNRPATKIDNDELKTIVEENTFQTMYALAERFNVSIPAVLDHPKQIGKVKKLDNWVSNELKEHQMTRRLETCCSLLSWQNTELFLHRIVTCGKKMIHFNNCKRSTRWLDKDEIPKHTLKPELYQKKLMVLVWRSSTGVIHYSFMRPGTAITTDIYINQLDERMRKLAHKQPRLVNRDQPILFKTTKNVTQNTAMELRSTFSFTSFTRLSTNSLPFFPSIRQLFTRKNLCILRTGKNILQRFYRVLLSTILCCWHI